VKNRCGVAQYAENKSIIPTIGKFTLFHRGVNHNLHIFIKYYQFFISGL
jgi:hypothetical protein